jgi:thiamine pyrophosphokinase
MSKFAILLGGDVTVTERLRDQLQGARVIAADSGMRHAKALGVVPELWVGDFDSASPGLLQDYGHVPRQIFPAAKDATDGALAVREAVSRGATSLCLAGAFGGQFDHALSHAVMLVGLDEQGVKAVASSGREEAHALRVSRTLKGLAPGTGLSIIGLTALSGLSISGVRWPLHKRDVELGSTLTMSNEVTSDVVMTLEAGRAVVLLNLGAVP